MNRLISIICIVAALILNGCSMLDNSETEGTEMPVPVEVTYAVTGNITLTREYYGRLEPVRSIIVVPKIPGKVSNIYVRVGQKVKKGDILFELDNTDAKIQMQQAEDSYELAKLNIESVRDNLKKLEYERKQVEGALNGISNQWEKINNGLEEINNALNDIKILPVFSVLSIRHKKAKNELLSEKETLIKAKEELEEQKAELLAVKKNLDQAIDSTPSNDILDKQLKQAQINLEIARNLVNNHKVFSPIDGVIHSINIDEGEMASQGIPCIIILDIDTLLLNIYIMEQDIGKVNINQQVTVNIDGGNLKGRIKTISPAPDQRNLGYPVSIELKNYPGTIKPGMMASSSIIVDQIRESIIIPLKSVIFEDNKNYVYVIEEDVPIMREIITGIESGGQIAVLSGLKEGEIIVTKGQGFIIEGKKVEIIRSDSSGDSR